VYSLGAILYELVTGQVPFDGDSDWEVLKKHEVEPLQFPDGFPPAYRELVETAMSKNPEERFPSAIAMRNAFLTATGHDAADTATPTHSAHAPVPPPESAVTVSSPPPASNPTTLRINELARDASTRFKAYVRDTTGPGLGAVGSAGSALPAAPPATPAPAPPPTPAPTEATRSGPAPAATPAPRHKKRYGVLIFALFITVLGFFTLMFFLLTTMVPRSRIEVHPVPNAAPVPASSRPGVRPPTPRVPSSRMVPAGLEGDKQTKPADEAEAAARKRQLKQNLARLNRLVNEHGSVIKEFLDLMEDVNLAEVLQQLRGNDQSR
jgi:serine/threonine protein kinase